MSLGLRTKIGLLLFGVLGVVSAVALALIGSFEAKEHRDALAAEATVLAQAVGYDFGDVVEQNRDSLQLLQALADSFDDLPDVKWVTVFDENATVIAHTNPDRVRGRPLTPLHKDVMTVFREGVAIEKTDEIRGCFNRFVPIGDRPPTSRLVDNSPLPVAAVIEVVLRWEKTDPPPVKKARTISRALKASVGQRIVESRRDCAHLEKLVSVLASPPQIDRVYAVDARGFWVAHSDLELIGKPVEPSIRPRLHQMLASTEPYEQWSDDGNRFTTIAPVFSSAGLEASEPLGYVGVETDPADLRAHLRASFFRNAGFVALLAVLSWCVLYFALGRYVLTPIGNLARAATLVAGGALDTHVDVASRDRIGDCTACFNTMVGELRARENTLRESELRYRAVVEDQTEIVVRWRPDGAVTFANGAYCRFFNQTLSEVIGQCFKPNIRDEDRAQLDRSFASLSADNPVVVNEYRVIRPGGDTHWHQWTTRALPDADGGIVEFQSVGHDVTERKTAEVLLAASEARFRRAIMSAPVPIMIHAEDGKVIQINETWTRVTGYAPEDIPTMGEWTLRAYGTRSDTARERIDRLYDLDESVDEGDFSPTTRDGDQRVWNFHSSPLGRTPDHGRLVISIAVDVTERRRTEQELRQAHAELEHRVRERTVELSDTVASLEREIGERQRTERRLRLTQFALDHCTDPIYWVRADGSISYANPAACQSLAYSGEELARLTVQDVDPDFPPERWESHWAEIKRGGGLTFESRHRTNHGDIFSVEVSSHHVEFEGEEYVWAFVRDITQRKRVEAEQRQLEHRLRQSQKMEAVGTLAAGVAHEFNNALTAILGYAELAKNLVVDRDNVIAPLDGIKRAVNQANAVTKGLLSFSRKGETSKWPVEVGPLLEESIDMLKTMLPAGITVDTDLKPEDRLWVEAEPAQLQQVLLNLCINSRDAMPDGGHLRVALAKHDDWPDSVATSNPTPPEGVVELIVTDTGTGIPEPIRERVLEPFFTTKPRGSGTGFGLTIVHGIVTDYGGTLVIASDLGRGTRVSVLLPRCAQADEPVPTGSPDPQPLTADGELVLLAEDNAGVREVFAEALRQVNYQVLAVADGRAAVEVIETRGNQLRLAVLDIDLPQISGLDCLRRIRIRCPDLPVILITGAVDFTLDGENSRDVTLIRKPIALAELRTALARCIAVAEVPPETQRV